MNSQPPLQSNGGDKSLPPIAPDFYEQDHPEEIDNVVPTRTYDSIPMVGLGGSAGSIQPLLSFFQHMPPDSGMVFVVVLHLSPHHESTLPELLSRATSMRVLQAEDGRKVEPNHVYVIPPGKHLAAVDGHLQLTDLKPDRGKRVTVDLFFRSMADTHGPHAAAVILSGADGDGALGIKRIKERGGLTIAQDPDEAEQSSMPRESINTGMVDWILSVTEIPKRLIEYRNNGLRLKLPPEEGANPTTAPPAHVDDDDEASLREVLMFLRARTGRDFSYYKRATIVRRIARRMQVNGVHDVPSYLGFLRTSAGEAGALLQDLLISVTNFFRDRESFAALEAEIPNLFKDKNEEDSVRVWVPACATGEEAYSIAMLLLEHSQKIQAGPSLHVFACDLDDGAIQAARQALYPATIEADVSEERLRRFFVKDHSGYRVRRELREMVLFAVHDLLKDPPFSRMDLVSCRNLLIYLTRPAQLRVLDTFHFALNPEGLLFLGSSESVDEDGPLFRTVDKKHRLYRRKSTARVPVPLPAGPVSLLRTIEAHQRLHETPVVHGKRFLENASVPFINSPDENFDRNSWGQAHYLLLERLGPPSLLINADHDVVHISESAGQFLNFAGGEPNINLLRVVRPAIRIEMRAALFRAAESRSPVTIHAVRANIDGRDSLVTIGVTPVPEIAAGFMLVTFDRRDYSAGDRESAEVESPPAESEPAVEQLERQLQLAQRTTRETIEEYEVSSEELKASNEELQAMNEELRSATEELETSREELQSINEELTTVNQELKNKVDELAQANSDLQNLMASTAIATVFLDRGLAITRYTPTAAEVFNIIPGDIGRPLAHLKHRLDYPQLIEDAEEVLRTLVPIEREVMGDGRMYLARVQPYRAMGDQIAGVVVTLVDITDRTRATEALRHSEERLRLIMESAKDFAIFTTDTERRVDGWNKGAESMFGYTESEILGKSADILFTPEDRQKGDPEREADTANREGRAGNERWHLRKDGTLFFGSGWVMRLMDGRGFVKIMRDLTQSKRTQDSLNEHMHELIRFNKAAVGRETRMIELKKEVNDLCARMGESPRYRLEFEREDQEST